MSNKTIQSALISVYHKDGLDQIVEGLKAQNITVYSTGGTYKFLDNKGLDLRKVEDLTSYPSILGGRVKTLHPKVFGGILAKREDDHLGQLAEYDIPTLDLVIVDLYPFEETVANTDDEDQIIEKIDIGGIALIRAAAKNYQDVVVIPSKEQYQDLEHILAEGGNTDLDTRKTLSAKAFGISSGYDTAIHNYLATDQKLTISSLTSTSLRYGENPHQKGIFFGEMSAMFDKLGGKELSYNNLVDVDAAICLMKEFKDEKPTCAILKHTNACGVATADTVHAAWTKALEADSVSAFGGIFIFNSPVDEDTAKEIDKLFYEVVIAPDFTDGAKAVLMAKKKRILLRLNHYNTRAKSVKSILNGYIEQEIDQTVESPETFTYPTKASAAGNQESDLVFALKCAKHLKSNTIVFAKDGQMLSMGCGQTSRVDACKQAIQKAAAFGLDLKGSVMASDAFFPFPDCVELAAEVGVTAVVQPGGSIKDNLSIEACDAHGIAMAVTGIRHFKH